MGTNLTEFSANARAYILLDDWEAPNPTVHSNKTLYKVRHFINVTSRLSVDGGGSAQVVFNDMDMKFWKYMKWKFANSREWGDEKRSSQNRSANLIEALTNKQEIENFRKHLQKYGSVSDALKALQTMAGAGEDGGILVPLVTPQNLIWIHYMGRDGYWYAGFTGVINNIQISESKNKTPVFTVNARTPDIFFENSQIAIRKALTFGTAKEQLKTIPSENLAFTNEFAGQITSEVIVNTLDKVNKFFLYDKESDKEKDEFGNVIDYRYYKVRKLFGFGEDTGDTTAGSGTTRVTQAGEKGYSVDHKLFENKKWYYDDTLNIETDFYNGTEIRKRNGTQVNSVEKDWLPVVMDNFFYDDGDKVKPFQNLVATNIQLFTVDKMTAKEVLDTVKKTVFCQMYFRGDGAFVIERPYFDIHLGMLDSSIERNELPPDYDLRYLITKQDKSYLSHSYSEDSSKLVTRTEMEVQPDWYKLAPQISAPIKNIGRSEASWKTTFKFGEKQVQLNSIVSPKYAQAGTELKDKIFSSYCYAMRMILSSDYRSLTLELDQRPDIQLNRNMLFMDLGLYFVTKEIIQTFNPQQHALRTSVTGQYVRPVGFQLVNPYRFIVNDDGSLSDWEKVTKYKEASLTSPFGATTEKNNPLEIGADGETFESIEEYVSDNYGGLTKYNNESGKSFDELFSSTGTEKRPYIVCFRGLNSSHNDRQDFYDDLYLMLPSTQEFKKINSMMSCGDAQTAGTLITNIETNYFLENRERPYFEQFVQLSDGLFRYNRQGSYWVCKDFEYYDLYSDFRTDAVRKKNDEVLIQSNIAGQKINSKFLSYMGADCYMAYNQSPTKNSTILYPADPKGKWWEGVNIFPSSSAVDSWTDLVNSISVDYIDVFVFNYTAHDEETIKSGDKNNNANFAPLNLTEPQKLFYNLKFLQSNFGEINNKNVWIEVAPKEYDKVRVYGNTASPQSYFGLYNVSDEMIGYTLSKDLKEFKNIANIDVAISKQHQWGSAYYSKLQSLLDVPVVSGYSLNALYDLASTLHVNNVYGVKIVANDGSSLAFNYPFSNSYQSNTFLKGNRGALVALLHIFLQNYFFNTAYTSYGSSVLTQFANITDKFFNWTELGTNYTALNDGNEVTFSNLIKDDIQIDWINSYFLAGIPSKKISYLKFLKLFFDRVSL